MRNVFPYLLKQLNFKGINCQRNNILISISVWTRVKGEEEEEESSGEGIISGAFA